MLSVDQAFLRKLKLVLDLFNTMKIKVIFLTKINRPLIIQVHIYLIFFKKKNATLILTNSTAKFLMNV